MKYAVKMVETLTRTVVIEADNYTQAEDKIADACNGRIKFTR